MKSLTPPQKLRPSVRKAAIKGVPAKKARAISASEPVAPKMKRGKTVKPLARERIAAILDALRRTYPNVVCALNHQQRIRADHRHDSFRADHRCGRQQSDARTL